MTYPSNRMSDPDVLRRVRDRLRVHAVLAYWAGAGSLREDSAMLTHIYRLLLRAARARGIDRDRLPDFLDLEDGGEFALLG